MTIFHIRCNIRHSRVERRLCIQKQVASCVYKKNHHFTLLCLQLQCGVLHHQRAHSYRICIKFVVKVHVFQLCCKRIFPRCHMVRQSWVSWRPSLYCAALSQMPNQTKGILAKHPPSLPLFFSDLSPLFLLAPLFPVLSRFLLSSVLNLSFSWSSLLFFFYN